MSKKRDRSSPNEERLSKKYDNLEKTIVILVNELGQLEAAQRLGVSQNWVSRYLKRLGYNARTIYQKSKQYTFLPPSKREDQSA